MEKDSSFMTSCQIEQLPPPRLLQPVWYYSRF